MKKSDIVGRVAKRMGLTRSAAEGAVDTVLESIAGALSKEEAVRIAGFGTFATKSQRDRGERVDRSVKSAVVVFHIKWNRFPRLFGCLKSGFPCLRQLIVTKYHAWLTQNMVLFALN